jgi:TonB family protein
MRLALALSLALAPIPAPATPQAPVPQDREQAKVAGQDVPVPKRTREIKPEYPAEALARGQRGIVILELLIDAQGKVSSVEVVRSVPPFDEAAVAAARKWEFEPTRVDGKPVSVRWTVPITFMLKLPELSRQEGIPELREGATPVYPASSEESVAATVTAEITLNAEGQVVEAQLRDGESPWVEALLQAVRTWRFARDNSGAVLSFRVKADFIPARGSNPPRVALDLSGLRRSESFAAAEAPPGAPAPAATSASPSAVRPAAEQASPAPSPAPAPPSAPPVEALPAPAAPAAPEAQPPPAQPPGQPGVSAVRDVSLGPGTPDLSKGRRPVVPPLARMSGVEGDVRIRFAVDAAGATSVQSVQGPEPLRLAAEQTVASWVFRRTTAARLYMVAEVHYRGDSASATVRLEP